MDPVEVETDDAEVSDVWNDVDEVVAPAACPVSELSDEEEDADAVDVARVEVDPALEAVDVALEAVVATETVAVDSPEVPRAVIVADTVAATVVVVAADTPAVLTVVAAETARVVALETYDVIDADAVVDSAKVVLT
jgi:hypothetical protein